MQNKNLKSVLVFIIKAQIYNTPEMDSLYKEITQRDNQKARTWHNLRVKIKNEWQQYLPMNNVEDAYEVYLERISFARTLVGKDMREYDELARHLVDLYTAGYIWKNVIYNPNKHWGKHPGQDLWDGQMMTEWTQRKRLWTMIHQIPTWNPNGTKDWYFLELEKGVSNTIEDEKTEIDDELLTGTTTLNREIYIVLLDVYRRLVDFYHKHTTYTFKDFDKVVGDLYRNQDERGFHQHCDFILRRIMQEIEDKKQHYSNEASYWREHHNARIVFSRAPREIVQMMWTHWRKDITEDDETRKINTPRFLR